jgi:hypothetical protein
MDVAAFGGAHECPNQTLDLRVGFMRA